MTHSYQQIHKRNNNIVPILKEVNHSHQLSGVFFPILVQNFERNLFTKKKKKFQQSTLPLKTCIFILGPTL